MNAARFVTGWLTAEVTGERPEKFLQALAERGIPFWDASPPRDFVLRVKLPLRCARLVEPMAVNVGCQAKILEKRGLPALAEATRRRWTLRIGVLLALAMLAASSLFVWDIDVDACSCVDESRLRAALADAGVDIGAYWPAFSQDMIRNAVLLELPELRWVTVNARGSRAEVIVRPDRAAPAVTDEEQIARVVASRAGLVTEVRDERGTAAAVRGQTVLEGETLIDAVATGRFGPQGVTRAVGEVWARTWYELSARAPLTAAKKTYTGAVSSRWAVVFGKNRINFTPGGSICPSGCDKITEEYKLAVQGLFELPVALVRERYRAYELSAQPSDAGEQQAELEQALAQALSDRIGADGEVLSAVYTASEADGRLTVTLRAECEQQIGRDELLTDSQLAALENEILHTTEEINP